MGRGSSSVPRFNSFNSSTIACSQSSKVSGALASSISASRSLIYWTMTWSKEDCSSSLALHFQLGLVSQLVMIKVRPFTLRELLIFTSKVKMHFLHEGMELWTSFISPKQLNTKYLSCASNELDDFLPILILVKTKDLRCLSLFSL